MDMVAIIKIIYLVHCVFIVLIRINSIDDFKIGDYLDFTIFMSCISNLFVKL